VDEILTDVDKWLKAGRSVALATVVRTWGSAPRQPGSKMAVNDLGEMSGSVSAGCVEAAVVDEALRVLKEGRPRRLRYGVADETAWEVGLTCGGEIDIFVEALSGSSATGEGGLRTLEAMRETGGPSVRAVVIDGPAELLGKSARIRSDGVVSGDSLAGKQRSIVPAAHAAMAHGIAETASFDLDGSPMEILLDPLVPPPTLVIVGGVHIAMALCRLAHAVGYRVVVVDPREVFASTQRFPEADVIERSWPDEGLLRVGLTSATAVAALSHDPKLDDPALLVALRSQAFYVGALGSLRTNEQRRSRLLAAGLTEEELDRLHAPIGLNLGRGDPEAIALGILAEVVAARAGLSREDVSGAAIAHTRKP
jgi:xanthine dehydrogenase accessory factor